MNIDNSHGRKQTANPAVYPLLVLPNDATNADVASVPPGTVFARGTQLVKSGASEFDFPVIPQYDGNVVPILNQKEAIFRFTVAGLSDELIFVFSRNPANGEITDYYQMTIV